LLADALVDLARAPVGDDFQVVVNVDLETLAADAPGTCQLACGTVLAPETARRLACDKLLVPHHGDGIRAVAAGRKTRFASKRLNRLLDQRDRGCRFPGCLHTRYLHTHHIVHWAQGGATSADNLVRLCSHHHRLVHEGGYSITGDPDGELVFQRFDGRRLRQVAARPRGSCRSLKRLNRRRGIDPTDTTLTPAWDGAGLELDWALSVLVLEQRE
jgi:hypothetical protein